MSTMTQQPMKNFDPSSGGLKLTAREQSLLPLIVRGRTNAEIAAELGVGRETVKSYVDRLRKKLSVKTKTEIAVRALQLQLVQI